MARGPGNVYWTKTFPDEEVPIKVLSLVDMPLSAEMYVEVLHPRNQDKRDKWDKAFLDHEILETYSDNQGIVRFMRSPATFPLVGPFICLVRYTFQKNRLVRQASIYSDSKERLPPVKTRRC